MAIRPSTSSQRSSAASPIEKKAALLMRGWDWIFIELPRTALPAGFCEAAASVAGLDLGPQPVEQALGRRVIRADGEQPAHDGLVRIDGAVVQHGLVDERLARQVAVRV